MAKEFKLPELGENIHSATITKILVKAGDAVAANQTVLEIETDKAVAEIPCPIAGMVAELRVKEGQSIQPGDVILLVDEAAGAPVAPVSAAPAPPQAAAPPAPKAVVIAAPPQATAPVAAARPAGASVLAAPSVRKLARELGVDLSRVPTADPSGRLTAQDVLAFSQGAQTPPTVPVSEAAPVTASAEGETGRDSFGPVTFQAMNAVRRKTAEHMTNAWQTIPHVTNFEKADVTALEEVRRKHAKKIEAAGGKLTMICFLVKVLVAGFKRYPKFNASIDLANQRLVLKDYCNIGIAVDTPSGLLVPVIRDADKKSLREIAVELPQLAEKARARKLAIEDMQGGTFTITNLGGLGGTGFTPIINAPESAILGVSRSIVEAVWTGDAFAPRTMLPLSLSYDHRMIDGADAARFARFVAEALENPWTLFLD
jgi:pyruvate dehydrogenase E2 component (dihydrolipoamide acetyltransferase)